MARSKAEGQGAFDFDAGPAEQRAPPPPRRKWGWEWWDPIPRWFDDRMALQRQVERDERAIEEAEDAGPGFDDMVPFFRERLEANRRELRRLEGR